MKKLSGGLFRWRGLANNFWLFLICLLIFIISAAFSFLVFFPADVLQRRIAHDVSRETGIKMRGEQASMLFPLGLKLNLTLYSSYPELADLHIDDLRITPAWPSLVSGNPGLHLRGDVAGGGVVSRIWRNGNLVFHLRDIPLLDLQRNEPAYRLNGLLSGQLQREQANTGANRNQGTFNITIQNSALLGLEQIGLPADFSLGLVQVNGRFEDMRVSFEQIVATGGTLELSGGGTLLVGATPAQTRLNLNVRLHPTQQTPISVRDLLSLTGARPAADGSYVLQIGGTLARPVIR